MAHATRHVIADLIRNPEGQGGKHGNAPTMLQHRHNPVNPDSETNPSSTLWILDQARNDVARGVCPSPLDCGPSPHFDVTLDLHEL